MTQFDDGIRLQLQQFLEVEGNLVLADTLQFGRLLQRCNMQLRRYLVMALYDCGIDVMKNLNHDEVPVGSFRMLDFKTLTVPEGVDTIGQRAFFASALQQINLPESLLCIEAFAFAECTELQTIRIPDGVASLHNGVFYGCTHLEEIYLPNELTFIASDTFNDCISLKRLFYPATTDLFTGIPKSANWSAELHEDATVYCSNGIIKAREI